MGLGHLPELVMRLRAAGAAPSHPAALISQATLPGQQILRGTLAGIVAQARVQQVAAPAVLIVGNIAAFAATESLSEYAAATGTPALAAGALA